MTLSRDMLRDFRRLAKECMVSDCISHEKALKLAEMNYRLVGEIYRLREEVKNHILFAEEQEVLMDGQRHVINSQAELVIEQAGVIRDQSLLF